MGLATECTFGQALACRRAHFNHVSRCGSGAGLTQQDYQATDFPLGRGIWQPVGLEPDLLRQRRRSSSTTLSDAKVDMVRYRRENTSW